MSELNGRLSSASRSSQGNSSNKESSSLLATSFTDSSGEQRRGSHLLLSEWNESGVNKEKWDQPYKDGKSNKSTLFDDPDGKILMPPSLKVHTWKRPSEFIFNTDPGIVKGDTTDLISANDHLMCSELMRCMISEIYIVWTLCNTPVRGQKPWTPWEHIYSLCKATKNHVPLYNVFGKYVVRLYWMGCWRKLTIDDTMPFDEEDNLLLPASADQSELWPMLLAKALIKLANTDVVSERREEMGDFSFIHALTGWLPEIIPIQCRHTEKVWQFLKETLPELTHQKSTLAEGNSEAVESATEIVYGRGNPTATSNSPTNGKDSARRTRKDNTDNRKTHSGSSRPNTARRTPSKGTEKPSAPEMVVCANFHPLQPLDSETSVLGEMADSSECLRQYGLSRLYSHVVLLTRTRACPLLPPPISPPVPRWKLIRPRKKPIPVTDEPREPIEPKPEEFIEVFSPFLSYRSSRPASKPKDKQSGPKKRSSTLSPFPEAEEREDPEGSEPADPEQHAELNSCSPPSGGTEVTAEDGEKDDNAATTDDGNETPGTLIEAPGTVNEAPGPLNEAPNTLNETSGPLNEAPNTLNETPVPLNEGPNTLNETPGPLNEAPNTLNETPGPLNEAPNTLNETPGPLNEAPNTLNETPGPLQSDPTHTASPEPVSLQSQDQGFLAADKPMLQETWVDKEDFTKCFQALLVFHKPHTYQKHSHESGNLKCLSSDASTKSTTALNSTTSLSQAVPAATCLTVKPQCPDESLSHYLYVDSLQATQILVSFSALMCWGETAEEKMEASARRKPGFLLARPQCWKSLACQLPVLIIQTTSSNTSLLSLPPGRHALCILIGAAVYYHMHMCSMTPFVLGTEETILARLNTESLRYKEQASSMLGALTKVVTSFASEQELPAARKALEEAWRPQYRPAALERWEQRRVFNRAVHHMLSEALNRKLTAVECSAARALAADPSLFSAAVTEISATPEADAAPPEGWRDRQPTVNEVQAVTVLQAGFRGHQAREVLNASKPGTKENLAASKTLSKIWSKVELDAEKHAFFLLGFILSQSDATAALYRCQEDEWTRITFRDYTVPLQSSATVWGVVFREVFHVPTEMFLVVKIFSPVPLCVLHIIDNDTGVELPRVFNNNVPHVYVPNKAGYTFIADAYLPETPLVGAKWRMRLIGSRMPLPLPAHETPLNIFSVKEFQENYIPNVRNHICHYSVEVQNVHIATVQLQTSRPDVLIRMSLLDRKKVVASHTGKGHVVIPVFIFQPNTTDPPQAPTEREREKQQEEAASPVTEAEAVEASQGEGQGETTGQDDPLVAEEQPPVETLGHKYIVQAEVIYNSWILDESELAFIQSLQDMEKSKAKAAAMKSGSSRSVRKPAATSKPASKQDLDPSVSGSAHSADLSKPYWTLRIVSDQSAAESIDVKKDTERIENIKAIKQAWEAAQPGRAAKALVSRLHFLYPNQDRQVSPAANDETQNSQKSRKSVCDDTKVSDTAKRKKSGREETKVPDVSKAKKAPGDDSKVADVSKAKKAPGDDSKVADASKAKKAPGDDSKVADASKAKKAPGDDSKVADASKAKKAPGDDSKVADASKAKKAPGDDSKVADTSKAKKAPGDDSKVDTSKSVKQGTSIALPDDHSSNNDNKKQAEPLIPMDYTPFIRRQRAAPEQKSQQGAERQLKERLEQIQSYRLQRDMMLEHRRWEEINRQALMRTRQEMYEPGLQVELLEILNEALSAHEALRSRQLDKMKNQEAQKNEKIRKNQEPVEVVRQTDLRKKSTNSTSKSLSKLKRK